MAHPMSLWFFFFLLRKLKFSSPGQLPNRFPLLPAVAKIVSHGCSSGKENNKKEEDMRQGGQGEAEERNKSHSPKEQT